MHAMHFLASVRVKSTLFSTTVVGYDTFYESVQSVSLQCNIKTFNTSTTWVYCLSILEEDDTGKPLERLLHNTACCNQGLLFATLPFLSLHHAVNVGANAG